MWSTGKLWLKLEFYAAFFLLSYDVCTIFPFFDQVTADFWQTWKDFEVRHGNEDTMREMLRIKRSVQATYNTQVSKEETSRTA